MHSVIEQAAALDYMCSFSLISAAFSTPGLCSNPRSLLCTISPACPPVLPERGLAHTCPAAARSSCMMTCCSRGCILGSRNTPQIMQPPCSPPSKADKSCSHEVNPPDITAPSPGRPTHSPGALTRVHFDAHSSRPHIEPRHASMARTVLLTLDESGHSHVAVGLLMSCRLYAQGLLCIIPGD